MKTVYHYELFVSIFDEVYLFCCYFHVYGTSKQKENRVGKGGKSMRFFAIPTYVVTPAKADIFLIDFLKMVEM